MVTFNGNSSDIDYDQSHKIGSRINRYSNMNPNYRTKEHGPLVTNSNSLTTNRYFEKYSIPEIKRNFMIKLYKMLVKIYLIMLSLIIY